VSDTAKSGGILIFHQRLSCFRRHGGSSFSDVTVSSAIPDHEIEFHDAGVYNATGPRSYPAPNATDLGEFKGPTPRNIAIAAPFMHDGSITPRADGRIRTERGSRPRQSE
jgi:cytochrome c peroxidase